jgi:hypothetical protein
MFAKIYAQIFDSSIAENYELRHFFEDMLKLADCTGVVDMTAPAIARRINLDLQKVLEFLRLLQEPDPTSRSKEHEGRRLVPLDSHRDWGWILVNYVHYRNLRDEAAKREFFRDAKRKQREKQKKKPRKGLTNADGQQMSSDISAAPQMSPRFPATEAEAILLCATQAVPEAFVVETWNKAMSRGGCDAKGLQISSFMHYVLTEHKYERERPHKPGEAKPGYTASGKKDYLTVELEALERGVKNL